MRRAVQWLGVAATLTLCESIRPGDMFLEGPQKVNQTELLREAGVTAKAAFQAKPVSLAEKKSRNKPQREGWFWPRRRKKEAASKGGSEGDEGEQQGMDKTTPKEEEQVERSANKRDFEDEDDFVDEDEDEAEYDEDAADDEIEHGKDDDVKPEDLTSSMDDAEVGEPLGMTSKQILDELSHSYNFQGGATDVLLKAMKLSDDDAHQKAQAWMETSHEAVKAASHVIAEATNDAEHMALQDAKRVGAALKGNMKDETAKMKAVALDPLTAKEQIWLEMTGRKGLSWDEIKGARIELPPLKDGEGNDKRQLSGALGHLNGATIVCNQNYKGKNQHIIRGSYGTVISGPDEENKYRVNIKHWAAQGFSPELAREDFEVLNNPNEESESGALSGDHVGEGVGFGAFFGKDDVTSHDDEDPADRDETPNAEWVAAMDTYGQKPVYIHHIPDHLLDKPVTDEEGNEVQSMCKKRGDCLAADNFLNKVGMVIDYRRKCVGDKAETCLPEFRIKREDEPMDMARAEREKQRPWLVIDRDFNFVTELYGKEVQVNIPQSGDKGKQDFRTSIQDRGMVKKWHSDDGGYFDVDVFSHPEKVQPVEIEHLDGLPYIMGGKTSEELEKVHNKIKKRDIVQHAQTAQKKEEAEE